MTPEQILAARPLVLDQRERAALVPQPSLGRHRHPGEPHVGGPELVDRAVLLEGDPGRAPDETAEQNDIQPNDQGVNEIITADPG